VFFVTERGTNQSVQLKQETWVITNRLPRRQKKATRNDGDFVIASETKQSLVLNLIFWGFPQ
jgi:hypothetical protein